MAQIYFNCLTVNIIQLNSPTTKLYYYGTYTQNTRIQTWMIIDGKTQKCKNGKQL